MTTYDLITNWIKEANDEYKKAKMDVNYLKMKQIQSIIETLKELRNRN